VTVAPAEILDETGADAEDVPVLGTAVSGSCHCLVTGDKKLLEIGTIQGIPIIRPTQFWGFEDRELQAKL
jgi:predicted nucleic acid-binding protein